MVDPKKLALGDQCVEFLRQLRRGNGVLFAPNEAYGHLQFGQLRGHVVADGALGEGEDADQLRAVVPTTPASLSGPKSCAFS
jgi:hypothetical protein